jgi:LEA14-like dessication related protein
MKRTIAFVAAVTSLSLLAGCSAAQQALNIQNPRYTIRDLRVRPSIAIPLDQSSIDFDFAIAVDNPNTVGLNLNRLDFSIFVNDNRLLDSISNQRISIPARGVGEIRLTSRVPYRNIGNIFREISDVIQGNRARYEVRGNAYYQTPVGELKFPVTVYTTQ